MLYLVIDPQVFILSDTQRSNTSEVNQFVARLVRWAEYADTYDIEFGITNLCVIQLTQAKTSIFNPTFLDNLIEHFPHLFDEMILVAFQPLLENLQNNPHLDQTLADLESSEFIYEVEEVLLSPVEHLERLTAGSLRETFQEMLGVIVFARKQQIVPLSDLSNVRLLTTYTVQEQQHWANDSQYRVIVHIDFGLALEETITDYQTLQALREFNDEFETLFLPDKLVDVADERQFSSVVDAVEAACKVYPKRLVFTAEALKIAQKSAFPDKIKIYRLIRMLVEIWLPAYRKGGKDFANDTFYQAAQHKITGESEQVNQNPHLRSEREANYNGKLIYAELHIKLSGGTRIYFALHHENDEDKIILTRVGKHPPSARFDA